MRVVACFAVLMVAAVVGRCTAEEPTDTRTYWVYEGGWFAKNKDGSWYELNELTYRQFEKPVKFKEVERTKEYIQLYDEKRKVKIQIYADYAAVRSDGPTSAWAKLSTGRWKMPVIPE